MKPSLLRPLSIVGYFLMVAGLLLLVGNRGLFSQSPLVIVLQMAAVALMIWARWTFGRRSFHLEAHPTDGGLVTSGPYRFIRHPIYASVLMFVAAGVGAHFAPINISAGCFVGCGAWIRMMSEEQLVRSRYPEYDAYSERTKRLIPFIL